MFDPHNVRSAQCSIFDLPWLSGSSNDGNSGISHLHFYHFWKWSSTWTGFLKIWTVRTDSWKSECVTVIWNQQISQNVSEQIWWTSNHPANYLSSCTFSPSNGFKNRRKKSHGNTANKMIFDTFFGFRFQTCMPPLWSQSTVPHFNMPACRWPNRT